MLDDLRGLVMMWLLNAAVWIAPKDSKGDLAAAQAGFLEKDLGRLHRAFGPRGGGGGPSNT